MSVASRQAGGGHGQVLGTLCSFGVGARRLRMCGSLVGRLPSTELLLVPSTYQRRLMHGVSPDAYGHPGTAGMQACILSSARTDRFGCMRA